MRNSSNLPFRLAGWLVPVAVAVALVIVPATADAQNKLEQARQHFDRGTQAFRQGRFEEALDELMKAYVLDPNPLLVYNIGRVHEERGDLVNALKYFQNYVKMAPRAKNRRKVKRSIKAIKRELKARPSQGILSIQTQPRAAQVRVNGRPLGTTPIRGQRMSPGQYRVEIYRENYQTWSSDVVLLAGKPTRIDVKLADRPTPVLVNTNPPGAIATLLGQQPRPLGRCPCIVNLSSGRYKLRVEAQGFAPRDLDFVKRPFEDLKLPVTLVPSRTTGRLVVNSTIQGAQVQVDGQPIGRTPLPQPLDIRVGNVNVEVLAQGYVPWRQMVQVGAGGVTRVLANLQPMGAPVVNPRPVMPPVVRQPLPPPTGGGGSNGAGWTLLSIGIAATVGGLVPAAVLGPLNKRQFDSGEYFKNNKEPQAGSLLRQDMTQAEALALEKQTNDYMLIGGIAVGVGVGLVITGAILLGTSDGGGDPNQSLSFSPIPGGGLMHFGASF